MGVEELGVVRADYDVAEAVVLVCSEREPIDPDDIITTVKSQIAGYKAPRYVVFVDEVYRAPNGKADYRWAKQAALDGLE